MSFFSKEEGKERKEFLEQVKEKMTATSLKVVRAVFEAARHCRGDDDVVIGRILGKKSEKRDDEEASSKLCRIYSSVSNLTCKCLCDSSTCTSRLSARKP